MKHTPFSPAALTPRVRAILQEADRRILSMAGSSRYRLYSYLRLTAASVARTDSFYIGFCRENSSIVFPYNYDGKEYDDPNVNPYQPGGLAEWIVRNRQSYWSRQDNGMLLHRGRAFGDTTRRSREAVAVPLFGPNPRGGPRPVAGILSMLSYEEGVYSEEIVYFIERLAEALGTVLQREQEDNERRLTYGESTVPVLPTMHDTVDTVCERLGRLRRKAEAVRTLAPEDTPLYTAVMELCRECEETQTDTIELLLGVAAPTESNPLAALTQREQEVAQLLVQGLSNREIAAKLFVSETTVKTHCGSIIRKLEAGGRSGVMQILRPYFR